MAEFQLLHHAFTALGAFVYALCTDAPEDARRLVEGSVPKLAYPVLHSMDGPSIAAATGCVHEPRRNILQPAAWVTNDKGKLLHISISTGPAARLLGPEALRFIGLMRDWAAGDKH